MTWKPNAADLDIVQVKCRNCSNSFDTPWDAVHMLSGPSTSCGQCGCEGDFEIIADPSPNKL